MPTDLPPRRVAPSKIETRKIELPMSSKEGNLAFAIAVVLMLAISAALLWLHPADAAAATTLIQAR